MPEVGLGIGRYQDVIGGVPQEILTWYDELANRHLGPVEVEQQRAELETRAKEREQQRAESEHQRAEHERQQRERLEAFLRSQGFDPDHLPEL
jgi:nucleosome binding factor SPN SPT16 subunit